MAKEKEISAEEKMNDKTLSQNEKLIQKYSKTKAQRHVKVKNEPVFDKMIDSLHEDYAKTVVSNSALEILKLVQSDDF